MKFTENHMGGGGRRSLLLLFVAGLGDKVQHMTSLGPLAKSSRRSLLLCTGAVISVERFLNGLRKKSDFCLYRLLRNMSFHGRRTKYSTRSFAFTLAEVLITLGIIGIVAAMTMPTLMANARKQEASARLKKFYTTMYQAIIMSESHNGPSQDWGSTSWGPADEYDYERYNKEAYDMFIKYLAPYIKYTKIDMGKPKTDTSEGERIKVYYSDGSTSEIKIGVCYDFYFDVNGNRKPNKLGYDKFVFYFCPTAGENYFDNKNIVFGTASYQFKGNKFSTRENAINTCKTSPELCSKLLQKFDNWEFKDDYPYKL